MAGRGGQTRIGGIVIDILGNSVGFQKELKEVDRAAARFGKQFSKQWATATKGLSGTADQVLNIKTAILGLAGAAGFGALVKQTLDYADSVSDASDALGLTITSYQELSKAAALAGIDQEKFTASFSKFVQQAQGFASGDKVDVFTRLGISAQEAGGDVEALFNLVVQQLDQIPTQNEKLKLIGDLFGAKVAAQWAATLQGGTQGLAEMRAEVERTGQVIDEAGIRGLGRLADELDIIKDKFATAFAKGLIEGMTGKTGELVNLLEDPDVTAAIDRLANGARAIGEGFGEVPSKIKDIKSELDGLKQYQGLLQILGAGYIGAKTGAFVGGAFGKTGASRGGMIGFGLAALAEAARQQTAADNAYDMNKAAEIGPPSPFGDVAVPPLLAAPAAPTPPPPPAGRPRPLGLPGAAAAAADQQARQQAQRQASIDQFIESLKAETAGLQLEASAVNESVAAQQEAAVQKELLNTLTDKGIQLGTAEAAQIEEQIRLKAQAANDKGAAELLKSLDEEIASNKLVYETLGMTTEARVRETVIEQAQADAKSRGIILGAKEVAQLVEKADAIAALAGLQEDAARAQQGFEDAGRILASGFEDAILQGEKLSDVIDGLIQDLARLALQRLVEQPFVDALGSAGSAWWKSFAASPVAASQVVGAQQVSFNADQQAQTIPTDSVNPAPEINVYVATPDGTKSTVNKHSNGTGGIDLEVLVEQLESKMTANTLRGRGFTPLFRQMGVSRTGMSG